MAKAWADVAESDAFKALEPAKQDEALTTDPLGLGEDEPDIAGDKRAMDQAQALSSARTVYAIDAGRPDAPNLQLDF